MGDPPPPRPILLAVAAPAEARAVLRATDADPALADQPWALHPLTPALDLVVTGIGKANAAGAVARCLDPARHRAALSLGIAGALDPGLAIGDIVVASACVFADEGAETPDSFLHCADLGFPLAPAADGPRLPADPDLARRLLALASPHAILAPIATVSTCSATDALARRTRDRTGAAAEAMEGAAVALAASRLNTPAGELRVISNTTGDRAAQVWDIKHALAVLERAAAALAAL